MKLLVHGLLLLLMGTLAAVTAAPQIDLVLPEGFTINQNVNVADTKNWTIIEVPVAGETMDHWTELITIQSFNPKKYPSVANASPGSALPLSATLPQYLLVGNCEVQRRHISGVEFQRLPGES